MGISDWWGLHGASVVTHVAWQDTKHSAGSLGAETHSAAALALVPLLLPLFAVPYS
jgi:hypothetical protein